MTSQFELLEFVVQVGKIDYEHVAKSFGYGPSTLTRMLDKLEGAQLVMRAQGSTARWSEDLHITDLARENVVGQVRIRLVDEVGNYLGLMSSTNRSTLLSSVAKITKCLQGSRSDGLGFSALYRYPRILDAVRPGDLRPTQG